MDDKRKMTVLLALAARLSKDFEPLNSPVLNHRLAKLLCGVEFQGMGVSVIELRELYREIYAVTENARAAWRKKIDDREKGQTA